MKSIVTLSLRGRAFQLEEDAYRRLRQYLDAFDAALRDGRSAEAIKDVEHMLGDRLAACVDASKTVVTDRDVDAILRELPPVGGSDDSTVAPSHGPRKRKLYRVREGQMISGLCLGLAIFAQLDPAMVRSLFVIVGVFSGGLLVVLYLIAMFFVPAVETVEEARAAAQVNLAR